MTNKLKDLVHVSVTTRPDRVSDLADLVQTNLEDEMYDLVDRSEIMPLEKPINTACIFMAFLPPDFENLPFTDLEVAAL